ncbi:MAG: universal stress protein [Propionibacteriaceae bacterium]|nr:universal stress protein [Propionibacteriaceae bacterium]
MLRTYEGPARVIVGYDGSAQADAALRYGVAEAIARESEVVLVNAVDDLVLSSAWGVVFDVETIREAARQILRSAVDQAAELGMPVDRIRHDVELGSPAAVLARHSEEASLIVVGRHSVAENERVYVGSTAVGVASTARCPVVVVGVEHLERTERRSRIGVGVNTAAKGEAALEWALRECQARGGEVRVISVAKAATGRWFGGGSVPPELREELLRVTRERVAEMIAPLAAAHPGVPIEVDVSYGSPLDVLVPKTEELDLLVVGVQPAFPSYTIGGTTRGLMAHAHCPVVTILARDGHGS